MIVYKVIADDPQEGTAYEWHPTSDVAQGRAMRIRQGESRPNEPDYHEDTDAHVERVEIPSTKTMLLRWLNANLTGGQG